MRALNFEEFIVRLDEAVKEYPLEAEQVLNRNANKFVRALRANSPDSGKPNPNKLNKSWKKKIEGTSGSDLRAEIWSKAPHFHLVDRGHVQKNAHGQVTGYKQGVHFLQKTINEQEKDIQEAMGKALYRKVKDKLDG